MKRTLMSLCDNINQEKDEFIRALSDKIIEDNVDTIILVGTKPTLKLLLDIREYHNKKYSTELDINVLILQDIMDMEYIFERFKFKIKEYLDTEILIDITHGSSKVTAMALIISKIYGLKIQDGEVIINTASSSKYEIVISNDKSHKPMYYIKKLFNNYDYKLAREILYENYGPQDNTENMFRTIIDIYEKWDAFDYEKYDFTKIESYFTNLKEISKNRKAVNILMDNNNTNYNSYRIADLINNAVRRIEEERYDDAIIRLYRVLELIGEVELYEKYGFKKTDIHIEDINNLNIDETAKNNIKKRLDYKYPRYQIPLTTTYFILQKLYDKVGIYYSRNKLKYQELFQKRNISVLVHGNYKYEISEINEMLDRVTDLAVVYNENILKYMEELQFPKFKI